MNHALILIESAPEFPNGPLASNVLYLEDARTGPKVKAVHLTFRSPGMELLRKTIHF